MSCAIAPRSTADSRLNVAMLIRDAILGTLSHKYGYVFVSVVVQASCLHMHWAGEIAGWKPAPQCPPEIRYRICESVHLVSYFLVLILILPAMVSAFLGHLNPGTATYAIHARNLILPSGSANINIPEWKRGAPQSLFSSKNDVTN